MADEAAPPIPPTAPEQQRRAPWQPSPTDPTEPTISARALAKARGTVEDFARSYMPLLGLPVDDAVVLRFGAFILPQLYELDELNERGATRRKLRRRRRCGSSGRARSDDVQATSA